MPWIHLRSVFSPETPAELGWVRGERVALNQDHFLPRGGLPLCPMKTPQFILELQVH
jgi:hypothetical protein